MSSKDAIIYAASGRGVLLSTPKELDEEGKEKPERHYVDKGDFAFIPAWTEHQFLNESDKDLVWVVTRSGLLPAEVSLTGWAGGKASDSSQQQRLGSALD